MNNHEAPQPPQVGQSALTDVLGEPTEVNDMNREINAAKERLMTAMPYFRKAVSDSRKKGTVQLGVLAANADGSGNIEMRFEADGFFDDLALVIGCPMQTDEDDMRADALKFIQRHGLNAPN